jgi:hypothetical protein
MLGSIHTLFVIILLLYDKSLISAKKFHRLIMLTPLTFNQQSWLAIFINKKINTIISSKT